MPVTWEQLPELKSQDGGYNGIFEEGMTMYIESFIGDEGGNEGAVMS